MASRRSPASKPSSRAGRPKREPSAGREARQALVDRWQQRQDMLSRLVGELGGEGLSFRADLAEGRFWWETADGEPVVVASTRLLLSYSHTSRSILCGWANARLPASATVPAVPGLPERVDDCDEGDAWLFAMRVGDAVGAHFLYRVPNRPASAFLALWDVRAPRRDDPPFVLRPPWPHVERVIDSLEARLDERLPIDDLLAAFGSSFANDTLRKGSPFEAPLRAVGEALSGLAGAGAEGQREGLEGLRRQVARHQAS